MLKTSIAAVQRLSIFVLPRHHLDNKINLSPPESMNKSQFSALPLPLTGLEESHKHLCPDMDLTQKEGDLLPSGLLVV